VAPASSAAAAVVAAMLRAAFASSAVVLAALTLAPVSFRTFAVLSAFATSFLVGFFERRQPLFGAHLFVPVGHGGFAR
jgi:hypothetical protein